MIEGVEDVKCYEESDQRLQIHTMIFLLITSLIINGFSMCIKFWKAET